MIDDDLVRAHRARALNPEHPFVRGTAQNPDTLLPGPRGGQSASTPTSPASSQRRWTASQTLTGRHYRLFDYDGAADAERVVIVSWARAPRSCARPWPTWPRRARRSGVITVRLYRPFSVAHFLAALARDLPRHCRARPHQGARRDRRAALSGCGVSAGRGGCAAGKRETCRA